jgi:hypothetical protein
VRVLAAWGLGKLGDEGAIQYLAKMLDDPEVRTPMSFDPSPFRTGTGKWHRAASSSQDTSVGDDPAIRKWGGPKVGD